MPRRGRAGARGCPRPGRRFGGVDSAGDELRRRGLLGKHSHLTAAGRKRRDKLQDEVPERLLIAVLGTGGVDSELRKVLDAPDPPPGSTLIPKRRDKGERLTVRHHSAPMSPGTPGFPAAGEAE